MVEICLSCKLQLRIIMVELRWYNWNVILLFYDMCLWWWWGCKVWIIVKKWVHPYKMGL